MQAGSVLLILASLVLVIRQLRPLRGDALTILALLLIWVRLAAAALGETALEPRVAGLSLIALSTLATTALGVLAVPLHLFRSAWAVPFYVFMALGIFSGLLNGATDGLQGFVVLFAYFLVMTLLLHRAYLLHGPRPVLACLLSVFALPLAVQALSLVLGAPKTGPDGTLNYIGSYGHEAVYAIVATCALWLAAIYPWSSVRRGLVVVAAVAAGLFLANYRTMIVAIAPLLLIYLVLRIGRGPMDQLRRLIVPLALVVALVPSFAPEGPGSRFHEIVLALQSADELAKRPEDFTGQQKDVLSARGYIWSVYFFGFTDADMPQFLVGHGPGTRAPGLTVHAHNEYLRFLYEFGIVGAIAWFGIILHHAVAAIRAGPPRAGPVVAAGFATMLLASLGTSLFDRPEGMILLALLCSTTWYFRDPRRSLTIGEAKRTPPRRLGLPADLARKL